MALVKSLVIKGSADFGNTKAQLDDLAVRARRLGDMSPTITPKVDDSGALLKLKAFQLELKALRESGNRSGLQDLSGRLKTFGDQAITTKSKMAALKLESDALKASMGGGKHGGGLAGAAGETESAFSGLAGPAGIAALVGVVAGLAPIAVTAGVGLAGLGIAAKGVLGPVLKAASSAKGLQGAWARLDPEQRAAAQSLMTLKGDYASFQTVLKPVLLSDFAGAVGLAGAALKDIEPVTLAVGKAIGVSFAQIGQMFASQQFQQFFTWMGQTAPGDIQQLTKTFIDLSGALLPLLEDLQPTGQMLLTITDDVAKGIHGIAVAAEALHKAGEWASHLPFIHQGEQALGDLATAFHLNDDKAKKLNGTLAKLPPKIGQVGSSASMAAPPVESLAQDITDVNDAASKGLSPLLAYSGALITARGDAKTFAEAMKKSHGEIGLNTAAQRASFGAANTYIQSLVDTASKAHDAGRGVGAEITMLQNAIPRLEAAKTHSHLYWQEVRILVGWLHTLQAQRAIHEQIFVTGTGRWSQATTPGAGGGPQGPHASAGLFVRGGTPGRDSVLVNTMPGELIVPTSLVQAGAVDHLRGRVPGFGSGGLVGSYSGHPSGLKPWGNANLAATDRSILNSIGNAMAKGFMQSFAGLGGGSLGSGSSGPVQSIARSMLNQLGWGSQWPEFNALEMREAGWKIDATNPSSGAYGLPQALPPGKMASAGADWRTNPVTQLRWMMGYIGERYGNPAGAWAHEVSAGWYDRGGYLPPGLSIAMNGTGRPEPVGAAAGGDTYNITVNVPVSASPRETGRAIVAAIKKFEQGSGSGWRN